MNYIDCNVGKETIARLLNISVQSASNVISKWNKQLKADPSYKYEMIAGRIAISDIARKRVKQDGQSIYEIHMQIMEEKKEKSNADYDIETSPTNNPIIPRKGMKKYGKR